MVRTRGGQIRTAAHVLSWLRREQGEELPVDRVLEAIRSFHGVVPLGGGVDGSNSATPPTTPKHSVLTLFSAEKDGHATESSTLEQSDDKRWSMLLSSVQLPISGGQQEVQNALEMLRDHQTAQTSLDIETIRRQYFAGRRDFFAVRIQLLRAARNSHDPNAHPAREIVHELLKEGLREALLDEVHGRQFVYPPGFLGVGAAERNALNAWEMQFLEEESLLRELLLLTLVASQEKATVESAVKIAKTIHNWEVRVFDDVFTTSTLAISNVQEKARRLTQVGLLVALKLLHTIEDGQDYSVLHHVTKTFFLTELNGATYSDNVASPVPGVLLLAWATLLGRFYRKMVMSHGEIEQVKELQITLQHTITAVEQLHGFQNLNALVRSLVFRSYTGSDIAAILHPLSLHLKTLWELPTVAASCVRTSTDASHYQKYCCDGRIYQQVVAVFLNDMLSTLGYMEHLNGAQELHAMVKFVLPVLSDAHVAQQVLGIDVEDDEMTDVVMTGEEFALGSLLLKSRINLPSSLLSCVELLTALCCHYHAVSSPTVLRQVLKIYNQPGAGLAVDSTKRICRPVPPAEFYCNVAGESELVQCTRSFAYEDAESRLVVAVGTIGSLVQTNNELQVEWLLTDSEEGTKASLWDMLMLRTETIASGLRSVSFAELISSNSEDVGVLTAFFGFIIQLGQQEDGGHFVLEEMQRRWGEARLHRWWTRYQISSPEVYVPLLMRQHIALPRLLSASSEDLVSWGIRDRCARQQILTHFDHCGRRDVDYISDANSSNAFAVDGGIHLLRLIFKVLDGFLFASQCTEKHDAYSASCFHFVAASFLALQALLATTFGVELLMSSSLSGGREECVNLIVKSAKKLFEVHERLIGVYPIILATQIILLSVVRWHLSKEAQALITSGFKSESFVALERLWFTCAAEFAIEVLSTHESWKFVSTTERCEVSERCLRLLYVLVHPRKYIHEQNEMILAFEAELCDTLSNNMSLFVKLLRFCCAGVSGMAIDQNHSWDSAVKSNEDAILDANFPLVNESATDDSRFNITRLQSLVTTSLRIVEVLLASKQDSNDTQAARKILLMPINGFRTRSSLTLVTLCGRYLGYDVEDAPEIVYWSLQILQRAAVVLDYRLEQESRDLASTQSLVALFHEDQNFSCVRDRFANLLRASSPRQVTMQTETIELLTLSLEHQPNFLALLLFGNESDEGNAEKDFLPFITIITQFFEASEKLLEQSSELFCALLTFLVSIWEGAVHAGHSVHLKIMTALCAIPAFWPNVTRALKIHMPLDSMEEHGLLDMELAAAIVQGGGNVESLSRSYVGRSSAYGYLARGLIFQLVMFEWHNRASKQSDHPLVDVLETFREEGHFLHWLRSLTRLDYSSTQLKQYTAFIRRVCAVKRPTTNLLSALPVGKISMYSEGLICDASTFKWQFSAGGQTCPTNIQALKLVQWSNLQAAYLHAQLFSLAKWKMFMELCCLQTGAPTDTKEEVPTRRMSMISSPPRIKSSAVSTENATFASSTSSALSRFYGDRTSFELIQLLADVIKSRIQQHEADNESLDYFVLVHLLSVVNLLVSMLHHQLCLVIRKTRDPKLSHTRQRLEILGTDSDLKFDIKTTLELLAVIEKALTVVHESRDRAARELEVMTPGSNRKTALAQKVTVVPLFFRLETDFTTKFEAVTDNLYVSLFTTALLLARHLSGIPNKLTDRNLEIDRVSPSKALLQANLIGHSIKVIASSSNRKSSRQFTGILYQLSCCLFQEVLDNVSDLNSRNFKLHLESRVGLMPSFKELEHGQQGINALIYLLVQSFRAASSTNEAILRQEDACNVLHGLTAIVWNPANAEVCRRVMLQDGHTRVSYRLLLLLATELLPLLQTQMAQEESSSCLRGYVISDDKIEECFNVSTAHRMWCLVLDFVGGLLRLSSCVDGDDAFVWQFLSYAEPMLLAAIEPAHCHRWTRAVVAECQALLRFLIGLSGNASRRQCWRQAFPTSFVVLMEQSRQLLRHACVLLGNIPSESTRTRKDISPMKARASKKVVVKFLPPKSPRSPRSPSAFALARQTLLHEHLQAVSEAEKQELTQFYQEMETELIKIVHLSSLLLVKWTASLVERVAIVVVEGVRHVDEEQLVPLLEFIPPSEARSMSSSPGLGHLGLAMDYMLNQLVNGDDETQKETGKSQTVAANAINVCALLFLKTYLLHAELYELVKRDCDELKTYVRQLCARVSGVDDAGIDVQLFEQISKIVAG